MAGTRIEIEVTTTTASAALDYVSAKLSPDGQTLLLSDIGEYLLGSTRDRAALQVSPDGTPWQALSPRYARRKEKLRPDVPILRFDNHMLGDRLSWQVEGAALLVGTSAIQGASQHFGDPDRNLPARPWLGISEADASEMIQITRDHLLAGLSGGAP